MKSKTKPKIKSTTLVAFKEISPRILEIRGSEWAYQRSD
jgi:hypothetical protein